MSNQPKTRSDGWIFGVLGLALIGVLVLSAQLARRVTEQNRPAAVVSKTVTDPELVGYREVAVVKIDVKASAAIGVYGTQVTVEGNGRYTTILDVSPVISGSWDASGAATATALAPNDIGYVAYGNRIERQRGHTKLIGWSLPEKNALITSLSVSGKTLWVADAGNRTVWRYTTDGKRLNRVVKGLEVPSPHMDVAALPDGTAWVTNPGKHRLEHYAADGTLLGSWSKPLTGLDGFCGCCNPADIAVLPDGRIVTSEKGEPRVKVYKADGTFDCVVAGPECFSDTGAHDVATDAQGRIYVLDKGTVRVFTRK